jgi:hypothetical protein
MGHCRTVCAGTLAALLAAFSPVLRAMRGPARCFRAAPGAGGGGSLPERSAAPSAAAAEPLTVTPDTCARLPWRATPAPPWPMRRPSGPPRPPPPCARSGCPAWRLQPPNYVSGMETEFYGSTCEAPLSGGRCSRRRRAPHHQVAVEQVLFSGGQIRAGSAPRTIWRSRRSGRRGRAHCPGADARTACYDAMLAQAMVCVAEESVAAFRSTFRTRATAWTRGAPASLSAPRRDRAEGPRGRRRVRPHRRRLAFVNLRRILFWTTPGK